MRPLTCALSLLLCVAAACDRPDRRCRFGADHAVFRSASSQFDDVALVRTAAGPLAIFSDESGLYARALDAYGLPRARARRLAERCDAGLAAISSANEVWIACSRRAGDQTVPAGPEGFGDGGRGAVSLYSWGDRLQEVRRFAPVGEESHGVSLAVHAGRAQVAWQDAAMGGAQLWYAGPRDGGARVLSDLEWYAGTPRLGTMGGRLRALWDESLERGNVFESRIRMLDLEDHSRGPATVAEGHDASPSPAVALDAAGSWLAFRDRRKGHRKAGLYLSRLDARGSRKAEVRVGRADGVGQPSLTACLSGLVAATPRSFAGDYFVGVVHVARDLGSVSPEQQFYEDSREFSQVAAACLDSRLLLLIAERGRLGGGRAALRSVGYGCE